MKIKNIFILISLTLISLINYYLGGIISAVSFFVVLGIYGILIYVPYCLWNILIKNEVHFFKKEYFQNYFHSFVLRVCVLFLSLGFIIGGFSIYHNKISPATMPVYTISNGEKTVVFQSMSHIATPNFYQGVKDNIIKYKKLGYVYYFEGVQAGSKENHKKFDEALGIKFNENTYKNMSQLYGLVAQNNNDFLGLVNDKDINVDTNIDTIMKEYEALKTQKNIQKHYTPPLDSAEILETELAKLNERQLRVLRFIYKSFIAVIIKNDSLQNTLTQNFNNQELFDIILHKRNEILVDKILHSDDKNIILTYGLLHFQGVFEELQKQDIRWQIQRVDSLYPLK